VKNDGSITASSSLASCGMKARMSREYSSRASIEPESCGTSAFARASATVASGESRKPES